MPVNNSQQKPILVTNTIKTVTNTAKTTPVFTHFKQPQLIPTHQTKQQTLLDITYEDIFKKRLLYLKQRLDVLSDTIDKHKVYNNSDSYYIKVKIIYDYRDFITQTDKEPQNFIARIKMNNIGGKENINKYMYITEDSLVKAASNNRARELANEYNQLTDKMIETEKKIGGIQKLAIKDLNQSENGYVIMRGGEQQINDYNNLIKQYQLMAIEQINMINEIKSIINNC